MTLERRIALFFLFASSLALAQRKNAPATIEEYKSPDGALIAVIRSKKAPKATRESRVELRSTSEQPLAKKDYSSPDGAHGYGVTKAAWTSDSQFFVYSLESSGGHQAWHTPVRVFSRATGKVFSLDDRLKDSVSNPGFAISSPDKVTVELYFSKKKRTVSLSALKASR